MECRKYLRTAASGQQKAEKGREKNDLALKSAGFQVVHMMVLGNYICKLYLNVAAITMEIPEFLE